MLKEIDMLIPPPPLPSISNLYLTCEAFLLNFHFSFSPNFLSLQVMRELFVDVM